MHYLGLAFVLASALHVSAPQTAESLLFAVVPRQSEARSCGYAVLAGLLRYAGIDRNRDIRPVSGTEAITESSLLEKYGKLEKLGANGERATVADPARGLVTLTERELTEKASGFVLVPALSGAAAAAARESAGAVIQEAMERGAFLQAAAKSADEMPAGSGASASECGMELGIRTGSIVGQTGLERFSSTFFFSGDWSIAKALTLLFGVNLIIQPADPWMGEIRLESGMEWHREPQGEGQSLGLALMGTVESSKFIFSSRAAEDTLDALALRCHLFEPRFRLRYSVVADPWLLTGMLGAGLVFQPEVLSASGGNLSARDLAIRPSLKALCAFSSSLAGIAELGQSFIFDLDGSTPMLWEGTFELGMYIQAGSMLFRAGARFRLDGGNGPRGDAVFSCSL
ncbi:MAG: hypothetical protein WC820_09175 [Spirochaetales bacterium]